MEQIENKIEVDMTSYVSDEAKDLRAKIKSCQNQTDYTYTQDNPFDFDTI